MNQLKQQKSALVVDDDEDVLEIVRAHLATDTEISWKVYLVNDERGLDTVLQSGRQIDVALVDLRLQEEFGGHGNNKFTQDGMTVAEILKNKGMNVGLTSADVREYQRRQAGRLEIPIFDWIDLSTEVRHVFLYVAREMLRNTGGGFIQGERAR